MSLGMIMGLVPAVSVLQRLRVLPLVQRLGGGGVGLGPRGREGGGVEARRTVDAGGGHQGVGDQGGQLTLAEAHVVAAVARARGLEAAPRQDERPRVLLELVTPDFKL